MHGHLHSNDTRRSHPRVGNHRAGVLQKGQMKVQAIIPTDKGVFSAWLTERGLARLDFPSRTRSASARAKAAGSLSPEQQRWLKLITLGLESVLAGRKPKALPPLDWSGSHRSAGGRRSALAVRQSPRCGDGSAGASTRGQRPMDHDHARTGSRRRSAGVPRPRGRRGSGLLLSPGVEHQLR